MQIKIPSSAVAITFLALSILFASSISDAQTGARYEPPDGRVLHGAALPQFWNDAQLRSQYEDFQKYSGKRTAVVTWFASLYEQGRMTSWRQNYAMNLERVRKLKSVSLIKFSTQDYAYSQTGRMAPLKDIASGVYDAYFNQFADTIKDFGDPVFISIDHEMNGTWYPYSQGYPGSKSTSQDFIAAWRHIVKLFRARGATNAAWVWSPNVPDVGPVPAERYYPGDDVVDWVGVSFYSGNAIEALDSIYKTYAPRKPIFITEWATSDAKSRFYKGFPGDAQWVAGFFKALNERYPRVKAISWFQYDKDDGNYLLQRISVQEKEYSTQVQNPRYEGDAAGLVSAVPGGQDYAPLREVPREIVLQAEVPVSVPKTQKVRRRVPLSERVKLENVETEDVKSE